MELPDRGSSSCMTEFKAISAWRFVLNGISTSSVYILEFYSLQNYLVGKVVYTIIIEGQCYEFYI